VKPPSDTPFFESEDIAPLDEPYLIWNKAYNGKVLDEEEKSIV
jgi:hypothetical protein